MHEASGLDALAWGLLDGGVKFAAAYPGFHAHDLAGLLGCPAFSASERNAVAVAWGASLAGVRSAVAFKNVGLNDAADPFVNACVLGVRGGLVVVVTDDWDVEQSQIRQDSRPYSDLAPALWLEPCSVAQAYSLAREAPALSEALGSPVVLRVTNALCRASGAVERLPAGVGRRGFRRDPSRWVAHPVNVLGQLRRLEVRREKIARWVDARYPPPALPADGSPLRVGVGMAAALGAKPDLAVFTLPPPRPWLAALAASGTRVTVEEHGGPHVAGKVAAALGGGRVTARAVADPLSLHEYRVSERHEPLYAALRGVEGRVVVGDLGGHTMDPARTVDACLCYGASVGVATGLALAGPGLRVFCVTGDAAYLHSGRAALAEAVARRADVTVLVLDNGGSRGTGGQRLPGRCDAGGLDVPWHELDFPADPAELTPLLRPRGPRVIRLRTPF